LSKRSSGRPREIRLSRFQHPQAKTAREASRSGVKMSGLGVMDTSYQKLFTTEDTEDKPKKQLKRDERDESI
jgi:hypothetical protein